MNDFYKKVFIYINDYWKELKFCQTDDHKAFIGLPNAYICPSKDIFNTNQFYWDTYFTILGLLEFGQIDLAKGMVENLVYLYENMG